LDWLWRVGMGMGYKEDLGAELVPRKQFVACLRRHRDTPVALVCPPHTNCRDLIDGVTTSEGAVGP
jgi:hypothetical protein